MKNLVKYFIAFIVFIFTFSCKEKEMKKALSEETKGIVKEEVYRPLFHFTPKENWMNDPNGMFYLNGNYHLFFQYYPDSTVWGPMHWGHAVSKDLIKWEELNIALYPDSLGYIFSGSAVVDTKNTSGFGKDGQTPVVAIFTYHNMDAEKAGAPVYQSQGLAYSLDGGITWTKYESNPVLKSPGLKDFRDPKVIWDEKREQWVMTLATYEKTMFYGSKDLKAWTFLSDFGKNFGAHGGVWECPDLFQIKTAGSKEEKWVLIQSLNPGGANGGSGTQYFVGDFDGKKFTLDPKFEAQLKNGPQWLDHGRDNYAGVTWSGIPANDGRRIFIGWMSNWDYANKVPTVAWRSALTLPRTLNLKKTEKGYKLFSMPVREIENYYGKSLAKNDLVIKSETVLLQEAEIDLNAAFIDLNLAELKNDNYDLRFYNNKNEYVSLVIDNQKRIFSFDRTHSGNTGFSEKFANTVSVASFEDSYKNLNIKIWIDKASIEIFIDDGDYVMTEIYFMNAPVQKFSLKAMQEIRVNSLVARPIKLVENE